MVAENIDMTKLNLSMEIDRIDIQILELLVQNHNNKQISKALKIPLSTIQRRVRKLIEKDLVMSKNLINFAKFGFRYGSIHIYLYNCNIDTILEKVSRLKGVNSLEVHIGNSDIIAEVVYKSSYNLLDLISNVKKMDGVDRIIWSERMLEYPLTGNNISLMEIGSQR